MSGQRDGLPVAITADHETRHFALDVEQVSWQTIPVSRQGVDQYAGVGEQSLTTDGVWRRTRSNWILGAGQQWSDIPDESSDLRFYSSDGVNPWEERSLSLLNGTGDSPKRASVNTNLQMLQARVSGTDYLVVLDGNSVLYSSDPITLVVFTAHTGLAGTLTSITTDGRRVWVASGADIYLAIPGTPAVSVFSTYNATLVGYANGRLLAANGAELVEISSAGVATVLFTHPNSSFIWDGIVSSPGGIYVFGHSGARSEVFVITAIDTTGALDVPFVAMETPDGEILRAMCFYGGVMVLGTNKGLRLALLSGGGFLSFGPVIDEPGDVKCLEPQGEDVWFGWTVSSSINGLGRARLSRFTSQLVPAFAADIMTHGTVSGDVLSIATFSNQRFFAISGRGFYGELATSEASGTIDLGFFAYGVSEAKVFDSVTVWTDALPASCKVQVDVYADDSSTAVLTGVISKTGSTKTTFAYSGETEAERLRVKLTITQVGNTLVKIRRVTLRAAPKPFVAELVRLPLFLASTVRADNGMQIGMEPFDEWSWLRALVLARQRVSITVGAFTFDARLDAIEVEAGGLGGANGLNGFDDRRQFMEGSWIVTCTTLEPAT